MARRGFQGAVMRGFGARDHVATVTGTELLAPGFLRVNLVSETIFDEVEAPPTAWLRFWFPDPEGEDIEHQRAYTFSTADEHTGAFSVDFVLHEPAGPASAWAQAAQPGATISFQSLGSSKFEHSDELPAGYLLIGDSASIPAISTILRTVPAEVPVELYLEKHSENDLLIPLPGHPRLRTHWVPRRGPESLAAAIQARDWSDWYAWAAPESGSLKHLRARLKDEFGFPKSEVHAQAYWIHGRAMGKLRSQGQPAPESAEPLDTAAEAAADPAEPSTPPASQTRATTEPAAPARGAWRAQAGSRLIAPLRPALVVAGIAQGIVTLIQLAPFFLLVEVARLLLRGADAPQLWTIGLWAVGLMAVGALLSSLLLLWLHAVDARFERDLRQRLLRKLSRLPLGWFDARTSGQVKQLVQDDTFALHYLVTHAVPDAVAAVVAPVAVLVYLFAVDWRVALLLFLPILVYVFTMWAMMIQSGAKTSQALRWAERMNSEAGGYLEGQPVIRVFGGAAASAFRARLGEYIGFLNDWQRPFIGQKTLMDLTTRPSTFLAVIVVFGTLLVTSGAMDPVALLPFLLLGTTFGARLLGIGYGLRSAELGVVLRLREPTAPNLKEEGRLRARYPTEQTIRKQLRLANRVHPRPEDRN